MIEFHPFVTSGSSQARTRTARLIDRDANDCAISPPLLFGKGKISTFIHSHIYRIYELDVNRTIEQCNSVFILHSAIGDIIQVECLM